MNKIYGYDDKLMKGLIEFIKGKKGESLSSLFREYASMTGKSAGTIRNLYYAMSKKASVDEDFRNEFLSGVTLKTGKIERFSKDGERELLKKIMVQRLKTRSTRSAVLSLAGDDGKRALRYQNKYRSAVKNNANLVKEIADEIHLETGIEPDCFTVYNYVTDFNINKVKGEINSLVEKIAYKVRKENDRLKGENARLEKEIKLLKEEVERLTLLVSSHSLEVVKKFS